LDSFYFQINNLELGSELVLDSITANGISVLDAVYEAGSMNTSFTLDGRYFPGNALANPSDGQMNTNEIITLEFCYEMGQCPTNADIPFSYEAGYGCNGEICQVTSQTTFIRVRPVGSMLPIATAELNAGGIEICGTPGTVSIELKNPNIDTDQNVYTDVQLGFQTCDKPNLDVTEVRVNGYVLPDSTFSWVGDDINIDLTTNMDSTIGLSDYDMDGFYDDLPGGDSISAVVEISVVCGLEEANDCATIMCDAVQFYVEAKTNCGNTFKDFPAPDDFNLVYGPDSVSNPTEMEFGTTGIFGYDFGTYSNDGAPISAGPSELEVEFCYNFVKENIQDCPTGAKNRLEVLFSGAPKFIQDLQYVDGSAMVSTDGGMTYAATDSLVTFDTIGLDALLVINDGDSGSQVCYKYSLEMDSCICSPVGYFTALQQVVSTCDDCSGGCDILQACRVATFRADPNCDDCVCIIQNRHVRSQRANLGYVDKAMTARHTPETLGADSIGRIDLTRFIPGDTLVHEDYFVILDESVLLNLNSWYINWSFISNASTSSIDNPELELIMDGAHSILDEFSISHVGGGGTRSMVDLGALGNCNTVTDPDNRGVWNRFGDTYYTGGINQIYTTSTNSSNDKADNNFVGMYLWNFEKIGASDATTGATGSDCLDEVIQTFNIAVGDTIHFEWRAPLIKNPYRAALEILGTAPAATNIAQLYPSFDVYEHDLIAGDAAYSRTLVGRECGESAPIYLDCPGELNAETNMTLDDCGGNVVHEFTIRDLPGPDGDPWFTNEYRPFIDLLDVDGLVRAPLAYCAGAEVTLHGVSYPIQVDSINNMFCSPVAGYSDNVCAVDSGNIGKIIFNLKESGAPSLGFGLGNCDTLRLSYDLCMICPGDIQGILDYELVYDWSYYNQLSHSDEDGDYRCNIATATQEVNSFCDEYPLAQSDYYFRELGLEDTMFTKFDRTSGVFLLTDNRDPMTPITTTNLDGVLLASDAPAVSEEVQRIVICNPDVDDTAVGVVASVKVPSMVRFVDAYADAGKTMPLSSTELSDDGVHKIYSVTLTQDSLLVGQCDTIYVGTTLLFCPEQGSLPPKICVGAVSGCAPAEIKAVLSGSGGCSGSETCYTYIFGEVGLQTEFFDSPTPATPGLCDTITFNVLVKNVKQLVLLDLIPEFGLPPGLDPVDGSWQVAYPGGPNNFGAWTDIPDPDSINGRTYMYTDVADWSTYLDINGLEGVSSANALVDSNKVSFRFKTVTECDQFISGSKMTTITNASDPCSDGIVSSGGVESPGINIAGALPIDYAQILLVANPEVINCEGTINTFGITALNTSDKPTSDSVITCVTLPAELNYQSGSLFFSSPLGFVPGNVTETVVGSSMELCFNAPPLGPSQYFSINFEAKMDSLAPCGDVEVQTDIKSFVDDVSCSLGGSCGVFVQNSLNPSIKIELAPPFIAEDLVVFTDCPSDPDSMVLYYEYTINHNGPDAMNQNYTVNFYKDIDGDKSANNLIDELIGTETNSFSVNDGASILVSGSITVDADKSCPVIFEVVYETGCACNSEDKYFEGIGYKGLRDYTEPLALCTGECLDIEVCDYISVSADSIPSATGVPYILDIDWGGLNKYTLPHPSGTNLDSITYESMTDNSIGNGFNNILFSEGSYPEGFLVAAFPYPVNVSSVFIGGGLIAGWGNVIEVYKSTCYKLEYSDDGLSWTNSGLSFNGPNSDVIEENELPIPISAQYWRMSSCNTNSNWATSEFRLEGEPVPYQGPSPVSRVGNTVTLCIPADQGIDAPWLVEFTTGTGACAVTETLEIWNLGDFDVDLGPDIIACEGDCVDLEAVIPESAEAGATVVWTSIPPSATSYLSNTNSLEVEACIDENVDPMVDYIVTITFPGGCIKRDTITISMTDITPNSALVDKDEVCFYEGFSTIIADPGYDSYEWYQIIGGTPVLLEVTMNNTYTVLDATDYIVKAYTDGVLCPEVSTPINVSFEHCVDLALKKELFSPVPGSPAIGEDVIYKITVYNQGGQPIDAVTITDSIPLGLTMSASETDWLPLSAGPGELITREIGPAVGDLNPGDSISTFLTLTVLPGADATNTINYAEISQVINDDMVDVSDEDIDSTPDQDLSDDAGGNPDGGTDNTVDGDGSGTPLDDDSDGDEDDHDPATFPIFDLALVKSVDPSSIPADNVFDPGDTITYSLTVYNQGTVDADSIVIKDIYPCGFSFVLVDNPGWTDSLSFVGTQNYVEYLVDSLGAGESVVVPITFYLKTDLSSCTAMDNPYTNYGGIESANDDMGNPGNDIDSNPGSDYPEEFATTPNTEGDNDIESFGRDSIGSEDDHDPANIDVFDLALTKMLSPDNNPYALGDTATFEICVTNQGNVPTDSVNVVDYIPSGYSYSSSSDGIGWNQFGDTARIVLGPAEFGTPTLDFLDVVCVDIELLVEDPMGDLSNFINISEIGSATTIVTDTSGMIITSVVTSDNDGFFDEDSTNDPGGEVNGPTDDTILGEGGDEDDADPATIEVFDLALIKTLNTDSTIMPIRPGGTVTFDLTVYNQGTVEARNIQISDYIPVGLSLMDDDWFETGDTARLDNPISALLPGDSTTVSVSFVVDAGFMETSITNNSEIESAEDSAGGMPKDFDSTPGDVDGTTPDANDNDIDETNGDDDYDPEEIMITQTFDLALTKVVAEPGPYLPGDTVTFTINIYNQGTLDAQNVVIEDYVPTGMTNVDPDWNGVDTFAIGGLAAGDDAFVDIDLLISPMFMDTSMINNAEIINAENIFGLPDEDSNLDIIHGSSDDDSELDTDGDINDNGPGTPGTEDNIMDADDYDPAEIKVTQTFDLALRKTINSATVMSIVPGGTVIFDISLFNQGTLNAYDIQLSDYVPDGLTLVASNGWSMVGDTARLDSPISSLDAGDSTTVQISFMVDLDFMETTIINNAEIEYATAEDDSGVNTQDVDSNPGDEDGIVPDDNDNDIEETAGEDDYDPEEITIAQRFDLALRKTLNSATVLPINLGDTVTFDLAVFNQGTLDATNIQLSDYIPEGLTLSDDDWFTLGDTARLKVTIGFLGARDSITVPISFTVDDDFMGDSITNNAEIESQSDGSGTPRDDDDSIAGDNGGDAPDDNDNDIEETAGEDDYDPETIPIRQTFDVALKKELAEPGPFGRGDTITFNITVYNQGTLDADSVEVTEYVPTGMTNVDPDWSGSVYEVGTLPASDSVVIEVDLMINASYQGGSLVNNAEITKAENVLDYPDEDSLIDIVDGSVDDDTELVSDNDVDDDGLNTPGTTDNGSDADDYDPAFIEVVDMALTKTVDTPGPYVVGDTIQFEIIVYNQGSIPMDSIVVNDYIPSGYTFDASGVNSAWTMINDSLYKTELTGGIAPTATDTTYISLVINPVGVDADQYLNISELSSFQDEDGEDRTSDDTDSDADDMPDNDAGGEEGSASDDVVDGDGSGNPGDENPMTDEDDQDPARIDIVDFALTKTVSAPMAPYGVGDTITFDITIYNQGTVTGENIVIYDSAPIGLTFEPSLNPTWLEGAGSGPDSTVYTGPLAPMMDDVVQIRLVVNALGTGIDDYTNYAEIGSAEDEDGNDISDEDQDSTPDDDPTDDAGGEPDGDSDDEIDGDGTGDTDSDDPLTDEDDHDPATIEIVDMALTKTVATAGPYSVGDTIQFEIVVYNQGNIPMDSVVVNDYIPSGYTFDASGVNSAWTMINDSLYKTELTGGIAPTATDTTYISLVINPVGVDADQYLNISELSSFQDEDGDDRTMDDTDSDADDTPDNDGGGEEGSAADDTVDGDGSGDGGPDDPLTDEDDQDPARIDIVDFALTKTVSAPMAPYGVGDTITFDITIYNQGTVTGENFVIYDSAPIGLTFEPSLNLTWLEGAGSDPDSTVYTGPLAPMMDDVVQIRLVVNALGTGIDDYTNYAEIGSVEDEDGNDISDQDQDSTPDNDPTDDAGGEPDGDSDDEIDGDGSGDSDSDDPLTDEDDHDPATIEIVDMALRKELITSGPFVIGDTVEFAITVYNQGNIPMDSIVVNDYVPIGYTFDQSSVNDDWTMINDSLYQTTLTGGIDPGANVIVTISLVIEPTTNMSDYINVAELSSFQDEDGDDRSEDDADSTADDMPGNDTGGEPGGDTDNTVDNENGDEDDSDPAFLERFDLALTKRLNSGTASPIVPGSTVIFDLEIFNQGTVDAYNIQLSDYVPTGLTLIPSAMWEMNGDSANLVTPIARLDAGESTIVQILFTVDEGFMETSITNNTEIESQEDIDGPRDDEDSDAGDEDGTTPDEEGDDNDITEINGDDDYDFEVIEIVQIFDLSIMKDIVTEGPYVPGQDIEFQMTVCNVGTLDARSFEVTDYVPAGMSLTDSDTNDGWMMIGENTYTYEYDQILPALNPDSCIIIPILLTLDDGFNGGSIANNAEITDSEGDQMDENEDNDSDDELLILFDVALTKIINTTLTPAPLYQGSPVSYDITVYNQGTVSAFDLRVEDYFDPSELIFVDMILPTIAESGNAVTAVQSGATFTLDSLSAGDQVVVTLNFTVHPMATNSMIVNNAEITFASASPGGPLAQDEDSPLGDINNGSTNELGTDNEISDNNTGGMDLAIDQDDYDPALINVNLCLPQINACPSDWNMTVGAGDICKEVEGMNIETLLSNTDIDFENCGNASLFTSTYQDSLVREECNGGFEFENRTVYRTYTITNTQTDEVLAMCPQEITYEINECVSLTDYGTIGFGGTNYISVPSNCEVPEIQVVEEEEGVCGFVEYMWLVSTQQDANGQPFVPTEFNIGTTWLLIPGEVEPTLSPGVISQTTYYVRCARNFSCCQYGESNVVAAFFDEEASCSGIGNEMLINEHCDSTIVLLSPDNDFMQQEQMMYITNETIEAQNLSGNGSSLTLDAGKEIIMNPGFEIRDSSLLEVYNNGCKE